MKKGFLISLIQGQSYRVCAFTWSCPQIRKKDQYICGMILSDQYSLLLEIIFYTAVSKTGGDGINQEQQGEGIKEGLSEKARWQREGVQMSWEGRAEEGSRADERPHKTILPPVLPMITGTIQVMKLIMSNVRCQRTRGWLMLGAWNHNIYLFDLVYVEYWDKDLLSGQSAARANSFTQPQQECLFARRNLWTEIKVAMWERDAVWQWDVSSRCAL